MTTQHYYKRALGCSWLFACFNKACTLCTLCPFLVPCSIAPLMKPLHPSAQSAEAMNTRAPCGFCSSNKYLLAKPGRNVHQALCANSSFSPIVHRVTGDIDFLWEKSLERIDYVLVVFDAEQAARVAETDRKGMLAVVAVVIGK